MITPIFDGISTRIRPLVTYSLIALCVLIYLTDIDKPGLQWAAYPARFNEGLVDWLHLVTYQFLHGDFGHLFFNMLFLFIFGNNVEDALGHWPFLIFYVLVGVIAALVHGYSDPDSYAGLIGASGSISGVLGAYALLHPRAKIAVFVFLIVIRVRVWIFVAFWFGSQIFGLLDNDSNIAWYAHLGGFIAGPCLFFILGGRLTHKKVTKLRLKRRSSRIPNSD